MEHSDSVTENCFGVAGCAEMDPHTCGDQKHQKSSVMCDGAKDTRDRVSGGNSWVSSYTGREL